MRLETLLMAHPEARKEVDCTKWAPKADTRFRDYINSRGRN